MKYIYIGRFMRSNMGYIAWKGMKQMKEKIIVGVSGASGMPVDVELLRHSLFEKLA